MPNLYLYHFTNDKNRTCTFTVTILPKSVSVNELTKNSIPNTFFQFRSLLPHFTHRYLFIYRLSHIIGKI